ncbi:hypothetical protein IWX50DRAFT_231152 [Phyllosticta citricarpa]|uniref:Uncharacterized protein n=1 Tax=Phyllosticta citricarpa TaxID=55181 RepID=A0ABR1LS40_9PEZI
MASVQPANGPPHVKLPQEYLDLRMRKDEKFKDFYWRVRKFEKKLSFQPDTTDQQATIELWLSRLSLHLFDTIRKDNDAFKFETVYHLFERCCSIECHDKVREVQSMMSKRFNVRKAGNWALFEADIDHRDKLLGYLDIDDPEERWEKRRIDSWPVRLLPSDLEMLRLYTNGLENIKTEQELLESLRQVEFGQKWKELKVNPRLSRYWWDIQAENFAGQQEAATQLADNKPRKNKKSRAIEGDDDEDGGEDEYKVPAVEGKSRKRKKGRHVEEDGTVEQMASPTVVQDKSRKRKKGRKIKKEEEEEEEEEEDDEQKASPPFVKERSRKGRKRVHFEDDDDQVEESPVPTAKDKSRKRKKGRKVQDDEKEADQQVVPAPIAKEKSRKRKKSRQVDEEEEPVASPPATKDKSRKRKRSHHVEVDSDASSSDVDEKPRKKHKKSRSERHEERRK